MATIRKLRGKYQAIVRRKGFPDTSKTFDRKVDAVRWSRSIEDEMERSAFRHFDPRVLGDTSFGDLLTRYRNEVSPKKRGGKIEALVLSAMIRRRISSYSLEHLSPEHFVAYREERLKEIKPATVNKERKRCFAPTLPLAS
ncbi:hypothetical protein F2P47_16535 [Parvibaculum sedimenti]|uniref:Integrase n=1 Tax=Parvibaculum sedimenti TaxID=2608632 RepID=A0A6N6VD75_9HYPH|nr:hypothetical protein [Parvibaculum sedimenti]KAB7738520.1 hypothetical protein F2P47_16535 [Parvibaculum sedimenti]